MTVTTQEEIRQIGNVDVVLVGVIIIRREVLSRTAGCNSKPRADITAHDEEKERQLRGSSP